MWKFCQAIIRTSRDQTFLFYKVHIHHIRHNICENERNLRWSLSAPANSYGETVDGSLCFTPTPPHPTPPPPSPPPPNRQIMMVEIQII